MMLAPITKVSKRIFSITVQQNMYIYLSSVPVYGLKQTLELIDVGSLECVVISVLYAL